METAAAVSAAARGASMPVPSLKSPAGRKERRIMSDQSFSTAANELELDRLKLGHSDERTIFEVQQGHVSLGAANFFFIRTDGEGNIDDVDYEKQLHNLASKREALQNVEIELRARLIAQSEVVDMHKSFDAQINEQANVAAKLQEHLHEREKRVTELERDMKGAERELHAIRLDNEAAWAKENLLIEQSMELAKFRRECDNIEAERAHHTKQVHDLQEHIQEKERQLVELREQHRVAQETILYKDEQLREAQVWITRVQERDALQSNTNHSLQAELRERTEQYNQLWLGCQRQFVEMERVHSQTIQQLQLELAGTRQQSGVCNNESCISQPNSNDMTLFAQNSGSHLEANGSGASTGNCGTLINENLENSQSFVSSGNESPQVSHVPGPAITPSLLGGPSYLQPGQLTAVHPYATHQQGSNHSVPTPVSQPHAGYSPSVSAVPSYQHWQLQQAASEVVQGSVQSSQEPAQTENNLARSHFNHVYDISSNGQGPSPDHLNVHVNKAIETSLHLSSEPVQVLSSEQVQVLGSVDKAYLTSDGQPSLQQISSQFHHVLRLAPFEQTIEMKESSAVGSDERLEQKNSLPIGKTSETLLDERSLLSCIVRTIPACGKIRINSTLPNRLGKMLSPLHWHDYKRKYGKLDDFVANHPELFVIKGDFVELREGAQGIIAATAAVAKVAAVAAATAPSSCIFPSVALTPMAQANRVKKLSSVESNRMGQIDTHFISKQASREASIG